MKEFRRSVVVQRGLGRFLCVWLAIAGASQAAPSRTSAPKRVVDAPPQTPKILVLTAVEGPAVPDQPATFNVLAERLIQRLRRFELIPLNDALDPPGAQVRKAREEEGDAEVRAGQAFYDDLDGQKALAQWSLAMKAYEQTNLAHTFFKLTQTWVLRMGAQVANGDPHGARKEMAQVVPLDPRVEFSTRYFTPEDLAYAAQLKRDAAKGGALQLTVESAPQGAQVYVDGLYRGASPLSVTELPEVEHYVTVVAPGYLLWQQRAQGGAVRATLKPAQELSRYEAALAVLQRPGRSAEHYRAARQLAQFLGADQVLLTSLRRAVQPGKVEATMIRFNVADGVSLGWRRRLLKSDEAWGPQLDAPLNKLITVDEARNPLPSEEPLAMESASSAPAPHEQEPEVHKRQEPPPARGLRKPKLGVGPILLGGGGVLVLGGITFGTMALVESQQYSKVHAVGTDAAAPIADHGRAFAGVADGANLAGLIALGVGTYLTFFAPPPEGEYGEPEEGGASP